MGLSRVLSRNRAGLAAVAVVAAIAAVSSPGPARASLSLTAGGTHAVVSPSVHNDTSRPLRELAVRAASAVSHPLRPVPQRQVHAGNRPSPASPTTPRPAIPATSANFEGIGNGFSGPQGTFAVNVAPADPVGAVGPNDYFALVNTDLAILTKSGTVLYGPVPTNTLWSGFGGNCELDNDGDATVVYDRAADRFVITQFAVTSPNPDFLQCVAVSATSDPTGSYYRYSFSYSEFPDYSKISVWPDAYYVTANLYDSTGSTFLGGLAAAYDRARMLQGQPATQQAFNVGTSFGSLVGASVDSSAQPALGTPEWFVSLGASANQLAYWQFHVDWVTPASTTLTGPGSLPTSAFSEACNGGTCIPQLGTGQRLDSVGDRLMFRLAYRNLGNRESMVVSHSVSAGSSTGIRWYELRPSGGGLTIFQQGTYAPDSNYRWMPSIAMDGSGDIGLGFSLSGFSLHPEIHYTGRLVGDPLGAMPQGEGTILNGAGSQTGGLNRWGDYSGMTVDPADDCTFWYTNQYIPSNGSFNWHTRIGSFRFPSCGGAPTNDFSLSVAPATASVAQGSGANYTVSTAVTSGSAVSVGLTVSGLPSGTSGSFNPTTVTAGGSSTLTVSTTGGTPAGTYTFTVTGTGGGRTHTANATLVVSATGGGSVVQNGGFESGDLSGWTPGGAFTPIVVSPGHNSNHAAQLGSTSPVNGDSTLTQTIAVPSSGGTLGFWYNPRCPDTITYDQQQAQIRSTSGAVLVTLLNVCSNSGAWTQVTFNLGPYAGQNVVLWFNDHDDGYFADPTYFYLDDVTVGAGPPPPPPPPPPPQQVVNGDFEGGNLNGWTTGGAFTPVVVGSPNTHTGSFAAQLGSTSPVNGDSTLSQTIAVPIGGGTLSFWYNPHCPDTITYDQQQAQIRTTSGSVLATVLNVCSNSGVWTHVTFNLTPYAGMTVVLWFNDHDDGYFADPTFFYLDDVAIQ